MTKSKTKKHLRGLGEPASVHRSMATGNLHAAIRSFNRINEGECAFDELSSGLMNAGAAQAHADSAGDFATGEIAKDTGFDIANTYRAKCMRSQGLGRRGFGTYDPALDFDIGSDAPHIYRLPNGVWLLEQPSLDGYGDYRQFDIVGPVQQGLVELNELRRGELGSEVGIYQHGQLVGRYVFGLM